MMKWFITGDTHGKVYERIMSSDFGMTHDAALIILGDCGLNFWLNKTDKREKQRVEKQLAAFDSRLYCVRGNHEERPENLNYPFVWDNDVNGLVYQEAEFPNIRYFIDGGTYWINDQRTLILGGAYSVDKEYRLARAMPDAVWTGWFKDEQLTEKEMADIMSFTYKDYDVILSHTCPLEWMPIDMFLPMIDQSTVDKTMEEWLSQVKEQFKWEYWYCGHYHTNRCLDDGAYMLYEDIVEFPN